LKKRGLFFINSRTFNSNNFVGACYDHFEWWFFFQICELRNWI